MSEDYELLADVMSLLPDYRRAYQAMGSMLLRILEQHTALTGIVFGGPLAQTDYLLKEHHADRHLQRMVNDARVRLRRHATLDDTQLADNCLYDWQALCLFVSLISGTPVPAALVALFPPERKLTATLPATECLRVVVSRTHGDTVYAHADETDCGELRVCLAKNDVNPYSDWDWSALLPHISEGTQLNLIRPRAVDGTLYPEIVIFEPDCLIDISAIAACFESYAHSPLIHLLNKLKPAVQTTHTLLGNLASQFLDEALTDAAEAEASASAAGEAPVPNDYATSIRKFFRQNAVAIATCPLANDFHAQAQLQRQHIRTAINNGLARHFSNFRPQQAMVEPSFFSEMLGVQGRMDFLQLDQQLLIEQKAGKGGFPAIDNNTPIAQEKHYVQLLLYMLLLRYNYREQYEHNRPGLRAFLLYSKYENSLLEVGFSPKLMFEAIAMRNAIAANEYRLAKNGYGLLTTLTPDMLNERNVSGVLWRQYQRPQLEALLQPINAASPLEQAYYVRMLSFVGMEHLLAKVGSQTKANAGFADKWYSSLEAKQQAGTIYDGLRLLQPAATDTGRTSRIVLAIDEKNNGDVTNFRKGDIVVLYPYAEGHEPDVRKSMVFRCTIEDITLSPPPSTLNPPPSTLNPPPSTLNPQPSTTAQPLPSLHRGGVGGGVSSTLTLSLRATQVDARVFWYQPNALWAIEHDLFESSFTPLYRGLHAFLSAPQERRDLLMLQRPPRHDDSLTLTGDYGAFNELALRVKQARDLFLIIGPPGTGKTSFGMLTTVKEQLLTPNTSILLLAYTNRAVDEICSKLVEEDISFIRIGSRFGCEEAYRPYLLETYAGECSNVDELRDMIAAARVMVGTTTAFNGNIALFSLKTFDVAVVDEASQILEPQLMALLSATTPSILPASLPDPPPTPPCEGGEKLLPSRKHCERSNSSPPYREGLGVGLPQAGVSSSIRKIVLIGDHKQLPAVVQQSLEVSAVSDTRLHTIHLTDCRQSLFERLLKQYRDDPNICYMLCRQGRMHRDIARFPNEAFYQGRLREVPLPHQIETTETHETHPQPLPVREGSNYCQAGSTVKEVTPPLPIGRGWGWVSPYRGWGWVSSIITHRIAFVAVPLPSTLHPQPSTLHPHPSPLNDKVNANEADAIADIVAAIYAQTRTTFHPQHTVGVIVPYRNQIAAIRNRLARYAIDSLTSITIDTVERYQGSQRDYIVYGFTIQYNYQLQFLTNNVFHEDGCTIDRKLNVAMTRARKHLILVGNPDLLCQNEVFARLIDHTKSHDSYFDQTINKP